ncbi:MAG TPA: hypothetical protein PK082_10545 [Phycisphaerae bacterium]|nr:hypothetical protein [Phycisphaerae bacterium]
MAPLPVQQARAYPETSTGVFVSLADFENAPDRPRGEQQVEYFRVVPSGKGERQFVVNVTRTGAGAMEVTLPAGAKLEFQVPWLRDFGGYTLLSVALHSEVLRDDLRVTLTSSLGNWKSHRTLVLPGWNNVLIDIQRLKNMPDFDTRNVRSVVLEFADATEAVRFHLDDLMLIDNRREIQPVPEGVTLRKSGLDYTLTLPGLDKAIEIAQGPDGLWRLGDHQASFLLYGPADSPVAGETERLGPMGERCVGRVKLLESNPVRIRIANTWYFPTRSGEWASLAVRQVRWEYAFYGDGRWVTQVELNNSGGQEIRGVSITPPPPAMWHSYGQTRSVSDWTFQGPVRKWQWIFAPPGPRCEAMQEGYVRPGRLVPTIADESASAEGDSDHDGFDESEGCYFLAAKAGNCRFAFEPPAQGCGNPVFRVAGKWTGAVTVSSEGLAIRPTVRLEDGSVLFVLPGWINRRTTVEVTGQAGAEILP